MELTRLKLQGMTSLPAFPLFEKDSAKEAEAERRLRAYLLQRGQQSVDANVRNLLEPDAGRFAYFSRFLPKGALERLLVSGCAIGSEMILARNDFGFQEVHGSEVNRSLIDLAEFRLDSQPGFTVTYYDGDRLPYDEGTFSAVVSAHIIEHTRSPAKYLAEQIRILRPGAFLLLEFPDRYHRLELHTGLPSFEWLPGPLRDWVLRFKSSRFSGESDLRRLHYNEIRQELRPVSAWQIRWWLRLSGLGQIVHHYSPAPGYSRLIVRRALGGRGVRAERNATTGLKTRPI